MKLYTNVYIILKTNSNLIRQFFFFLTLLVLHVQYLRIDFDGKN